MDIRHEAVLPPGPAAVKRAHSGFLKEMARNKVLYLMFLPGLTLLVLFHYLPMFGIIIAFKNIVYHDTIFDTFLKSEWIGLKNFEFLFTSPDAFVITRNTILYNLAFITLGLIIPVTFAIILNELRSSKLAKLYQSTMFFPWFLSWVIVSYLVSALLNPYSGFINTTILKSLGMEGINWYAEPKYWPFILIILNVWKNVGYGTVIYLATITGIDPEYYEAAAIDGATRWQQIRKITIPMLKPMMVILTILAIGGIFRADFGLFYQVTQNQGLLKSATDVIDTYVYNTFMVTSDIGMSSAAGFYQSIVGFILVLTTNLVVKKINREMAMF